MSKIDSFILRALRIYNELNSGGKINVQRKEELSELELKIQELLCDESSIPSPIKINHKSGRHVSKEKLAYCFFHFPLKHCSEEGHFGVSAFDMIDIISGFVCCAQRYAGEKVLRFYNEEYFGPEVIHNSILGASSANLFVCETTEGLAQWSLYIPTVFSDRDWDEEQPGDNLMPGKFFIDDGLFRISRHDEAKNLSIPRNEGTQWMRNAHRVYFGDVLVETIEKMKYLPDDTDTTCELLGK